MADRTLEDLAFIRNAPSTWEGPEPLLDQVTRALRALGSLLGQTVFVLITTVFIVAELSNLPAKLRRLAPRLPARSRWPFRVASVGDPELPP